MPFETVELIANVRHSRAFFLRHLNGLTDDQWSWKPYPACKSIRQTLAHMAVNDAMAAQSLSGTEVTWLAYNHAYAVAEKAVPAKSNETLLDELRKSHEALLNVLESRFVGVPLETEVVLWIGPPRPLGLQIPYLSTEDHYHAGQVAFIRLATDPDWSYYAAVYTG